MPHADDIAALRRLLEGVEGFAGKMGWQWTKRRRHIPPDLRGITSHDIALAVGAAMEMLRERHGVRHLGRLIAEAVPDDAEFGSKGSPRLLPLLADILCGGRDDGH